MRSKIKADGTHVTTADGVAEIAIRQALRTPSQMTALLAKKSVRGQADLAAGGLWMELMERVVLLPGYQIGER